MIKKLTNKLVKVCGRRSILFRHHKRMSKYELIVVRGKKTGINKVIFLAKFAYHSLRFFELARMKKTDDRCNIQLKFVQ